MKNPDINRRHLFKVRTIWMVVLAVFLMFWCGPLLAAEHGETHGETYQTKGWAVTDTYRVFNFTVLAVGLFLLLRKPVSQALGSRINGIKEQLRELEEKKQAAEKELVQYNEKLSLLNEEAEEIVEAYIRQGNEATTRILKEAETAAMKLEENARRNIEHEFRQDKLKLQAEIIEQALVRAETDIIGKITSEDQYRLVDEYLEKVVA